MLSCLTTLHLGQDFFNVIYLASLSVVTIFYCFAVDKMASNRCG